MALITKVNKQIGRISFAVYPDKEPLSVVMYHLLVVDGNSQLDIIHHDRPNIPELEKMGRHRWRIRFYRKDTDNDY